MQAALVIDEAHNVFIPAFSTLLSEGRSGGIEVAAAFQYTGQIADESVRAGVRSLLQNVSIFRQRDFEDARAAAALAMEVFQDNIRGDVEDQRRIRIDPMDIVQQPNYRAVNLWLADGVPQPAATASTQPMEELVASSAGARARASTTSANSSAAATTPTTTAATSSRRWCGRSTRPVIARYRTIHIDLNAWPDRPPAEQIARVAALLRSPDGDSIAHIAQPTDAARRRYAAVLPDTPGEPGWLPEGLYTIQVLAWVEGQTAPRTWTPAVQDDDGVEVALQIELTDEPRRPDRAELETAA